MNIEFNGIHLLAVVALVFTALYSGYYASNRYKSHKLGIVQNKRRARTMQTAVAKVALIKLLTAVTDRANALISEAEWRTTAPYLEVRAHSFAGVKCHERTTMVGSYSAIAERMVAIHFNESIFVLRSFVQGPQAKVTVKASSGEYTFTTGDKDVLEAMHAMESALCSCPAKSMLEIISESPGVSLALVDLHTALASANLDPNTQANEIIELLSNRQQQIMNTEFKWDL